MTEEPIDAELEKRLDDLHFVPDEKEFEQADLKRLRQKWDETVPAENKIERLWMVAGSLLAACALFAVIWINGFDYPSLTAAVLPQPYPGTGANTFRF